MRKDETRGLEKRGEGVEEKRKIRKKVEEEKEEEEVEVT